ncbi:universal stress protein [Brevibacterium marinum]|uniref:Nucleotide-binding universal stress UspA family protein n=1 Tax=Brevibacterium marinum TaxID=418643 RepID=A0A846S1W4_9MICO|nr:universal stress protein [Brevibacterium marinum]NJC57038.1 nucleotide-binding universal stress UspA family protein [Brevibacterium marinum]
MRYVVGITMDKRGRDAVSLALTLAQSTLTSHPVELDLVHVIRGVPPEQAVSKPEREFQKLCLEEAQQWMAKTHDLIPKTIHSTTSVHFSDSMATGLIDKATERPCDLIVVGAASHGPLRRFTVGSVANALLHSSPVSVALAPSGYLPPSRLTRLTCALGMRPGAEVALNVATQSSVLHDVPLRLISLIAFDARSGAAETTDAASDHAKKLLVRASQSVDNATEVMVDVAHGRSIESAIDTLTWDEGEIVLIGSNRLARRQSIFLGTTANKMLRSLPVPMVVVPRFPAPESTADDDISI